MVVPGQENISSLSEPTAETRKTFDHQDSLPCLPLPELQETCDKFLAWMEPLLDEEEWNETVIDVEKFTEKDGNGPKLQKTLLDWSCREDVSNWLEPLWYGHYLKDRLPTPINSNVFFMLRDKVLPGSVSQAEKAAQIIDAALRFQEMILEQKLPCDQERECPLCMNQLRRIFANTRIPALEQDFLRHPCSSEDPTSARGDNILLMRQGHIFKIKVMDGEGYVSSPQVILNTLEEILSLSLTQLTDEECVGALTSMNRDKWAETRQKITNSDVKNAAILRDIENALYVVCLDDFSPASREQASRNMLAGDARNRWYDKSIEFIVCGNGTSAINYEHSSIDGSTVVHLTGFIYSYESASVEERGDPDRKLFYEELRFSLSDEVRSTIAQACRDFDDFAGNTSVRVLDFTDFGKDRIKTFRVSPDGFAQMGLQLAMYKLRGKPCTTYEPVATRRFLHGRTEAMRSVTRESVQFTRIMMDRGAADGEKVEALRAAAERHVSRSRECRQGKGVDRHLLGLKSMYYLFGKEMGISELPSLFSSPGYRKLCHNRLSTSTSGHAGLSLCGFGPVVEDGFGVRYLVRPDQLNFNLSSRKAMEEELAEFTSLLEQSLREMADLMERVKEASDSTA